MTAGAILKKPVPPTNLTLQNFTPHERDSKISTKKAPETVKEKIVTVLLVTDELPKENNILSFFGLNKNGTFETVLTEGSTKDLYKQVATDKKAGQSFQNCDRLFRKTLALCMERKSVASFFLVFDICWALNVFQALQNQ